MLWQAMVMQASQFAVTMLLQVMGLGGPGEARRGTRGCVLLQLLSPAPVSHRAVQPHGSCHGISPDKQPAAPFWETPRGLP